MAETYFKVNLFVTIGNKAALCLNASTLATSFKQFASNIVKQIFGTDINYHLFRDEEFTQGIQNQNQHINQKNIYLHMNEDQYYKCITKTFYVPKQKNSTPFRSSNKEEDNLEKSTNQKKNESPSPSESKTQFPLRQQKQQKSKKDVFQYIIETPQKQGVKEKQSPLSKKNEEAKLLPQEAPKKVMVAEKSTCGQCVLI